MPEESLLARLLPASVAVCALSDRVEPEPLHEVEAAAVAKALIRRQHEFALGRTCARRALAQLGVTHVIIPTNGRAPLWPEGIVGAIAHTPGLVLSAVARRSDFSGIGVDAESRERELHPRIENFICTETELERMRNLPRAFDAVRLTFSAKESVHKCIAPMSGITLGFHDVELDLDLTRGAFRARLVTGHRPGLPDLRLLRGGFVVTDRFVITAAIIPAVAADCSIVATVSSGEVAGSVQGG